MLDIEVLYGSLSKLKLYWVKYNIFASNGQMNHMKISADSIL
jgi:hypothetical protein